MRDICVARKTSLSKGVLRDGIKRRLRHRLMKERALVISEWLTEDQVLHFVFSFLYSCDVMYDDCVVSDD